MDIPALSQHEQALRFRAMRNQVLTSNIANADTPGYKARDLDFGTALKSARQQTISLTRTSDLHKQAWGTTPAGAAEFSGCMSTCAYIAGGLLASLEAACGLDWVTDLADCDDEYEERQKNGCDSK